MTAFSSHKNILFIGAGKIAQAIHFLLKTNRELRFEFWDILPQLVKNQRPLKDAVRDADIIFLCINSWHVRESVMSWRDVLRRETIVVCVSKGIEERSSATMDELLREVLPSNQHFGILSGPMLAAEILDGKGGAAVLASKYEDVLLKVSHIFVSPFFHLDLSDDIVGTALCGVLKNIYAIGLGIADGLQWGNNLRGWYVAQSLREMVQIVERFGGKRDTVYGYAGIGDFIATGFSAHSRNFTLGKELVLEGSFRVKSEGYVSLPPLLRKLENRVGQFPIFKTLATIILGYADAKDAFREIIPPSTKTNMKAPQS